MRVCAEFEDCTDALTAHRLLVDEGLDPEDIELRSPYPMPEAALPPHRERPFHMRTVVRIMWGLAVICGFSFVAYTQLDWNLWTDGTPIVPVPINALIMYECGMLTAILTTTFMFFWETRHFRQLVPPLEEDLPVANGNVALVVSGNSADRALSLLQNRGARSVVTYAFMFVFLGLLLGGCGTWPTNMRSQVVHKPGEAVTQPGWPQGGGVPPPQNSLPMPTAAEQQWPPLPPFHYLEPGDPDMTFSEYFRARGGLDKAAPDYAAKLAELNERAPEWIRIKAQGVPPNLMALRDGPVPRTQSSVERGGKLYATNCAFCHGSEGTAPGRVGELCV
ncbi:MAG: quinol:electron acceptor oxidoreductase subunit ActD, partial [Candidatus Eremiobacterota bacterium]